MVKDSKHLVFHKTPEEEGEQETPREVDVSWMAEHTKQGAVPSPPFPTPRSQFGTFSHTTRDLLPYNPVPSPSQVSQ
jgi:hypothetical protein